MTTISNEPIPIPGAGEKLSLGAVIGCELMQVADVDRVRGLRQAQVVHDRDIGCHQRKGFTG